jgi:molybdopterin converting factor small subunit
MRTIQVIYTGQLAALAGCSEESVEVEAGSMLGPVVDGLAAKHGEGFRDLLCDEAGAMRATVLVALDGVQAQGDRGALLLDGVEEVMLMTPIAGG